MNSNVRILLSMIAAVICRACSHCRTRSRMPIILVAALRSRLGHTFSHRRPRKIVSFSSVISGGWKHRGPTATDHGCKECDPTLFIGSDSASSLLPVPRAGIIHLYDACPQKRLKKRRCSSDAQVVHSSSIFDFGQFLFALPI